MSQAAMWIVGPEYLDQARMSARSVARRMPWIERHLFIAGLAGDEAGKLRDGKVFTCAHEWRRSTDRWYLDMIRELYRILESGLPADEILWLDSDTYMVEPAPELFDLLEKKEFAIAHAPGRRTKPSVVGAPDSFPELNIGVVAMRNVPRVRSLWRDVGSRLDVHRNVYGDNDQAPLRDALWEIVDLNWSTLPPEYDFRSCFPQFAHDPVKIIHARHDDYEQVARIVNSRKGFRVWRPMRWT